MQRYWKVPADRFGIPVADFGAMLDLSIRRYHQAPDSRYHAAVYLTMQWVAGLRDEDPMTNQHRPATQAAQQQVRMSADAAYLGVTDRVFGLTGTIHREWARGVARTLWWVEGQDEARGLPPAQPPLFPPAGQTA